MHNNYEKTTCPHCGEPFMIEHSEEGFLLYVPTTTTRVSKPAAQPTRTKEESVPKPKGKKKRAQQTCGKCGKSGHNKMTCPQITSVSIDQRPSDLNVPAIQTASVPPLETEDTRSLRAKILDLYRDGVPLSEIYEQLPDYLMPEIKVVYEDIVRKQGQII